METQDNTQDDGRRRITSGELVEQNSALTNLNIAETEMALAESHAKEAETVLSWAKRSHQFAMGRQEQAHGDLAVAQHALRIIQAGNQPANDELTEGGPTPCGDGQVGEHDSSGDAGATEDRTVGVGRQAGFSLIELMVTLGVMSIIAVMATGSFMSYSSRTQAAEAMNVTEGLRSGIVTHYADSGRVPPQTLIDLYGPSAPGALLTDHSGKYTSSVDIENGHLVITYGIKADPVLAGDILTMTPYETRGGGVVWQCGNSPVPVDGLAAPLSVAGTLSGSPVGVLSSVTTLDAEFLPRDCR